MHWCLGTRVKDEDEPRKCIAADHLQENDNAARITADHQQGKDNRRGAIITVLGMGAFVMTDAFSKYAVTVLQLPILQVPSLRGFGMVFCLTLLNGFGNQMCSLTARDTLLLLARVVFEVLGSYFFNLGLVHLPMSFATAIVQVHQTQGEEVAVQKPRAPRVQEAAHCPPAPPITNLSRAPASSHPWWSWSTCV